MTFTWPRVTLYALIALVGLPLLFGGAVIVAILLVDLRPWIEQAANRSLGRATQIGALELGWGLHLAVEARDIRIANAAWASTSEMVEIGHVSALVDLPSLLRGVIRYEKLHIVDMTLVLERAADGAANWKFSDQSKREATPARKGGFALVPKNRTQFPTLINFVVTNGRLIYRHSGSRDIEIGFQRATITSHGEDTPVMLSVDGSYNGAPTRITGFEMGSFEEMRDSARPFRAGVKLVTKSAALTLRGTFDEPIDFDGVTGPVQLDIQSLSGLLKSIGMEQAPDLPLQLDGILNHSGNSWQIADIAGSNAGSPFTGTIALEEGSRAEPDRMRVNLDLTKIDLTPLFDAGSGKDQSTSDKPDQPGLLVEGDVRTHQLQWGNFHFSDVALHAATKGQADEAISGSFRFAGGTAEAKIDVTEIGTNTHIAVVSHLAGADVARIAQLAGAGPGQITGTLDLRLSFEMRGRAFAAGTGQMAVSVTKGAISRKLLETASSDLRAIFRDKLGMVPIGCLLAVGDLQRGRLYFKNVRMRAADVLLEARGAVDLLQRRVDMDLHSRSGSKLALDRPFSIRGPMSSPSFGPRVGNSVAVPAFPVPPTDWVANNPCRR